MKENLTDKLKFFAYIAGAILVLVVVAVNTVALCERTLYPVRYSDIVEKYAQEYRVDKVLIYGIIKTESNFDENAVSSVGAMGLMQITPETFEWLQTKTGEELDEDALFDSDICVKYGALFMSMLLEEFENTETAIAAYHAGRGQVNAWLADSEYSSDGETLEYIPFKDTEKYVKKVVRNTDKYEKIYDFQRKD